MKPLVYVFLAAVLAPSGFARGAAGGLHHHDPEAGVVSLDLSVDGNRVHRLIATRATSQPVVLRYDRSDDGGETFSAAAVLGTHQPPTIAHRGMDAQIAAAGEQIVAAWPTAGTDKMGRGPIATAISSDGGRTWRAGPNPSDDGLTIGHSFIDLAADAAGAFHLVWLDSREGAGAGKGLRYSRSIDGGLTWSKNLTLDPDTCECCWNTIAVGDGGEINVMYRRHDPRDMAVIRSTDGGKTWDRPVTVGAFNWQTSACPHVGGGIVRDSTAMHAVVWTATSQALHGIYLLSSRDGHNWTSPRRTGDESASHPDIGCDGAGTLALAWDAYANGSQGIFVTRSSDSGETWSPPLRVNEATASGTHPRIVWTACGARVFWTETPAGGISRVMSRRLVR
jgi:hypothetical protein